MLRPRWLATLGALALLVLVLCGLAAQSSAPSSSRINIDGFSGALPGSSAPKKGGVSHVVLVTFRDGVRAAEVNKASQRLLGLKKKCTHPITKKPYIRSIRGGMNVSPENMNSHVTHAFVVEFDSIEHRDYYIEHDPVHKEFRKYLDTVIDASKIIVEFSDGKFT